jgi:hypothetical protein
MEMKLPVKIEQTVQVNIELEDVIEEINLLPLSSRMNIVAKMLNEIETENSEISDINRELILGYLQKQIIIFQNGKS